MANKPLVIPAPAELHEWISKSKKEMKIKSTAEFVRTLLEHIRNSSEIIELKRKMEKSQIERMLSEATRKAEEAAKEREVWEKRLEKITQ
jgi:hypothetical protein